MKPSLPEVLSTLRREKNISQRQAADALGVSQALLSHYEKGVREPKLEFICRACDYYGVTMDYMTGRSTVRSIDNKVMMNVNTDKAHILAEIASLTGEILETTGDEALLSASALCFCLNSAYILRIVMDPEFAANARYHAAELMVRKKFADRCNELRDQFEKIDEAYLKRRFPQFYNSYSIVCERIDSIMSKLDDIELI